MVARAGRTTRQELPKFEDLIDLETNLTCEKTPKPNPQISTGTSLEVDTPGAAAKTSSSSSANEANAIALPLFPCSPPKNKQTNEKKTLPLTLDFSDCTLSYWNQLSTCQKQMYLTNFQLPRYCNMTAEVHRKAPRCLAVPIGADDGPGAAALVQCQNEHPALPWDPRDAGGHPQQQPPAHRCHRPSRPRRTSAGAGHGSSSAPCKHKCRESVTWQHQGGEQQLRTGRQGSGSAAPFQQVYVHPCWEQQIVPERLGAVQEETRAAARTCSGFGPHQPVCQLKACGAILHLSPGGRHKPLGTAEARQGEGCAPVAEQCPQHAPTTQRWEGRLQPRALGALGTGTELPLQQHACRALETCSATSSVCITPLSTAYNRRQRPDRSTEGLIFVRIPHHPRDDRHEHRAAWTRTAQPARVVGSDPPCRSCTVSGEQLTGLHCAVPDLPTAERESGSEYFELDSILLKNDNSLPANHPQMSSVTLCRDKVYLSARRRSVSHTCFIRSSTRADSQELHGTKFPAPDTPSKASVELGLPAVPASRQHGTQGLGAFVLFPGCYEQCEKELVVPNSVLAAAPAVPRAALPASQAPPACRTRFSQPVPAQRLPQLPSLRTHAQDISMRKTEKSSVSFFCKASTYWRSKQGASAEFFTLTQKGPVSAAGGNAGRDRHPSTLGTAHTPEKETACAPAGAEEDKLLFIKYRSRCKREGKRSGLPQLTYFSTLYGIIHKTARTLGTHSSAATRVAVRKAKVKLPSCSRLRVTTADTGRLPQERLPGRAQEPRQGDTRGTHTEYLRKAEQGADFTWWMSEQKPQAQNNNYNLFPPLEQIRAFRARAKELNVAPTWSARVSSQDKHAMKVLAPEHSAANSPTRQAADERHGTSTRQEDGLEKKTTKPYQDESAQHFLGPHFIWGTRTCTPTPSHVPPTAPGTNPTSPGTSVHYSPPTLRPGVRHPATSEVPGHTLDLQEAPAFPEGSCAAAAPALPAGSRSMSLLWAELLQALAVSRAQHPKKTPKKVLFMPRAQHPKKMPKRVLFTMERAGKALAELLEAELVSTTKAKLEVLVPAGTRCTKQQTSRNLAAHGMFGGAEQPLLPGACTAAPGPKSPCKASGESVGSIRCAFENYTRPTFSNGNTPLLLDSTRIRGEEDLRARCLPALNALLTFSQRQHHCLAKPEQMRISNSLVINQAWIRSVAPALKNIAKFMKTDLLQVSSRRFWVTSSSWKVSGKEKNHHPGSHPRAVSSRYPAPTELARLKHRALSEAIIPPSHPMHPSREAQVRQGPPPDISALTPLSRSTKPQFHEAAAHWRQIFKSHLVMVLLPIRKPRFHLLEFALPCDSLPATTAYHPLRGGREGLSGTVQPLCEPSSEQPRRSPPGGCADCAQPSRPSSEPGHPELCSSGNTPRRLTHYEHLALLQAGCKRFKQDPVKTTRLRVHRSCCTSLSPTDYTKNKLPAGATLSPAILLFFQNMNISSFKSLLYIWKKTFFATTTSMGISAGAAPPDHLSHFGCPGRYLWLSRSHRSKTKQEAVKECQTKTPSNQGTFSQQ
ncbi:hypothetical protein Anapl_12727 [Anas platyrhynchos]|uniref:Uncharacterized protein n=1 Tax=Anas platyrhynchos TaxID=8839 RepID=R0JUT3_ANAPL|nr:hypothetical protein Anapl_12727 [Anas platyrhynchos]